MNQLIKVSVSEKGNQVVSARELHEFLEVKSQFTHWIKSQIERAMLVENQDYLLVSQKKLTNNLKNPITEISDYVLKLSSAKEIAMLNGGEKGKQARQYFIECERQLMEQKPKLPTSYKDALLELVASIEKQEVLELELKEKEQLLIQQAPKVDFADRVASSSDLIDIGTFAKLVYDEIGLGRNRLFNLLRSNGILMKNNNPYQAYIDNGTFKVIEGTVTTPYGTKITTKTLLTGEGQIKLLERLRKLEE